MRKRPITQSKTFIIESIEYANNFIATSRRALRGVGYAPEARGSTFRVQAFKGSAFRGSGFKLGLQSFNPERGTLNP